MINCATAADKRRINSIATYGIWRRKRPRDRRRKTYFTHARLAASTIIIKYTPREVRRAGWKSEKSKYQNLFS